MLFLLQQSNGLRHPGKSTVERRAVDTEGTQCAKTLKQDRDEQGQCA
jgi:hypothetical protein